MFSKKFLLIWGAMALLVMAAPEFAMLGMFFFILPGIILSLAPSVFIYAFVSEIFYQIYYRLGVIFPKIFAVVTAVGLGCSLSFLFNYPVLNKIAEIQKNDVFILEEKIELPQVFAMFTDGKEENISCSRLCQALLYNGAVKKILVGVNPEKENDFGEGRRMAAFFIEKKEACETENLTGEKGEDFAYPSVRLRIEAGECLVRSEAVLSEAGMIFVQHEEKKSRENWDLVGDVSSISEVELIQVNFGLYTTIYRLSKFGVNLLKYPLSISPQFGGSGAGTLTAKMGVNRSFKKFNGGTLEGIAKEYKFIFGDAMNTPEAGEDSGVILLKKLNKTEAKGEELSRIFDIFVQNFSVIGGRRTVSKNDEAAFIRSIGDVRVQGKFWNIGHILSKAYGEQNRRMAEAVIDRILVTPLSGKKQEDVKSLLSPLSWAASDVALTQEQLEKLHNNSELENFVRAELRKIASNAPERNKAARASYIMKWGFTENGE